FFSALTLLAAAAVGAEEYFVPMVGQRQGADGAWWNTEAWVTNTAANTGGYAVVFLAGGQANTEGLRAEPELEDLGPGATVYRSDLVPEGKIGVLRFITTPGVVIFVRVFNAAGRGSFGQGMTPLTRAAATRPGEIAHLVGLRRTPQFRTNIALFSPSLEASLRVRIIHANGSVAGDESFRLAPGGYVQLDDVLHAFGVPRGEHLRAELTGTAPFFAFASVIDARSGAPTLVPSQR
ncbi:MAG: hypothetical protein ACHQHM_01935, partial [Thermoanaerobaculales bacterium]